MKAIVAIKSSPSDPRRLLAHCYREHGREADEVPCEDRVLELFGQIEGVITRQAKVDCRSLLSHHHGSGKLVRHVVISGEDCADPTTRIDFLERLKKMAFEYIDTFAPGATFLGVLHQDRLHPHVHLLINNSVNGRTLNFSPKLLKEMQSMSWTAHAQPGRGAGQGKAIRAYPLAQNLDIKKIYQLKPEEINELIAQRKIEIGRVNRRGDITSIIYNGRRIRLSSIARLSTSATDRHALASAPRLASSPARSASRNYFARRRRTHPHPGSRPVASPSSDKDSSYPRYARTPGERVAPGFRPTLPRLVPAEREDSRVAGMGQNQNLARPNDRGTAR